MKPSRSLYIYYLLCLPLGLGLTLASLGGCQDIDRPFRLRLAQEIGAVRLTPGRLTGPFQYAPYPTLQISPKTRLRLRRLVRAEHRATLSDLGALKLVSGKVDEAIRVLSEVRPRNASTLSDLSAAYLAAGEQRGNRDLRPYIMAAFAADQAVQIDDGLPEAWFNRALALQALGLLEKAKVSWQRYHKLDKQSPWAHEGREEISRLEQQLKDRTQYGWEKNRAALAESAKRGDIRMLAQLVRRHPELIQLRTVTSLLGAWAESWKSGKIVQAKADLEVAGLVGDYFQSEYHDDTLVEAVERIRQASRERSEEGNLVSVADVYYALWEGIELYFSSGACQARPILLRAEADLRQIKSPLVGVVSIHTAVCDYFRGDHIAAQNKLSVICSESRPLQAPLLMSRCWWIHGMCSLRAGDPMASIGSYKRALGYSSKISMHEDSGAIHHLLAESYRYLGQEEQAWMHRGLAIEYVSKFGDYRRVYPILDELANAIADLGYPEVELLFRDEVVGLAQQDNDEEGEAFALIRRAETFTRLGNRDRARSDLNQAENMATRIQDSSARLDQELRRAITYSLLDDEDKSHHSVVLTEGLARCKLQENNHLLVRILLARARIHFEGHRIDEAKQDLMSIADIYESRRSILSEEGFRASYFSQAHEIFDQLISLELNQGNYRRAFLLSEQIRSRILLDRLSPGFARHDEIASPLDVDSILARIPEGRVLVEYLTLQDSLAVWVLQRGSLKFLSVPVRRRTLESNVQEFVRKLLANDSSAHIQGRILFGLLIRPIHEMLREGDTFVALPDSLLADLPFAALVDEASGRYLVEDHPIAYAPSASFYGGARSRVEAFGPLRSVLVLGNPDLRKNMPSSLPNLPGAERESALVASIYPGTVPLTGSMATDEAFLQRSKSASLVHVAVHALVSPVDPDMSALLFARGSETDGVIYAHELRPGMFRQTSLLVLASCRSGWEEFETSKGSIGLTGAFLGAGIPIVLASLWNLDDESSRNLMVNFHQELANGIAPAEAVRRSQVRYLRENPGSERLWAGLRLVGGV